MITSTGKHYLYRHIRHDKNEPFYIGIGTKNNKDLNSNIDSIIYRRAFVKNRNSLWLNVVNQTTYDVEILLKSDDYEFIKQKEIEFISLYKRKDCCLGVLTNLTDGGDGSIGFKLNDKQRQHLSNIRKGKVGKEHHLSKKVYVYSLEGNFIKQYDSRRQCALSLKMDKGCIDQSIKGKITQCFGYVFKETYLGEKIDRIYKKGTKQVYLLDLNSLEVLKCFDSVTTAAKFLKSTSSNVSKVCKDITKSIKGYKLKYKNE